MTLVAMRPVLNLAHQYSAGDELPVNNPEMTDAWLEGGCHGRSSCAKGESTSCGGRAGERGADG